MIKNCHMRHKNGNCLPAGGFCTANKNICKALHNAYELGVKSAQQEKQHGRIFQEIVVEYPSYNTYPEYKGKPYFSIKYTENGQEFIGYGTYKPEVLSEYLKEYFMPSAQPEQRYTKKELGIFKHGISLSLLSKRSAQHWHYDEGTATDIEFLERLYKKVEDDMRGEQNG